MMGRLPWTVCSILTWMVIGKCLASKGCPHPPVPAAATYVNVTGGLAEDEWHVRYVCNIGNLSTKYHQAAALSSSRLTFESWELQGEPRVVAPAGAEKRVEKGWALGTQGRRPSPKIGGANFPLMAGH